MKNIKKLLLVAGWLCLLVVQANAQAALDFDGTNDFVNCGTTVGNFGTGDFTIEFWFKTTQGNGGESGIISKRGGSCNNSSFWSVANELGRIALKINQDANGTNQTYISSPLTYNDNMWHHAAFTRSATTLKVYIDGTLASTVTGPGVTNISNTSAMRIGTSPCGSYAGALDEVRLWNVARTESQIQASMNCELLGGETGLQAYYKFNQSSGTSLPDLSGNANNGTLTNFALSGSMSNWLATGGVTPGTFCTPGAALDFDGTNDYVEVPNNPTLVPTTTQAITFEAWLNPSVTNAGIIAAIYDHSNVAGSNFYILKTSDNKILITGNGTNVLISDGTISLNSWTHVAIVFKDNDGTDQTKIYLNGILNKTGDLNYNASNGGQTLRLGLESNLPDVFKGGMDEVRIWNVARSATDIQNARNCELLGGESGLQAYYKFNQSSGTSLPDISGKGNSGTLTNFALAGAISNWVSTGGVTTGTTCTATVTTSQIYDFENLTLGNLNGQDNWATDGAVGINVINASTSGLYTGSKTLGNAAQGFVAASRLNNGAWSFPSMTGATQINIEASLRMNYWQVDFQLGQDVNTDGNFSNGSYTYDANELGIGFGQRTNNTALIYKADGTFVTASLATTTGNWIRFLLVVNTAANGGAGSGTLYFRNLTASAANWTPIPGLININMGINASANNRTNLPNLNGMFYQADKDSPSIDDILIEVVSPLTATISGSTTGCGSATLIASGGGTYAWSNGANTAEATFTTSGTYTVTVTNAGATATATASVTINPLPAALTFSGVATACDAVTLTAAGGTSYAWSNGANTAATTFTASGTYTVTATAASGCTASATQTVTVNKVNASISGATTGCDQVVLTASGGTLFVWTGGATGASATFDAPGNYLVTVTDANGCTGTAQHSILIIEQSKTYYLDSDGDGYGNSANPVRSCSPLASYILTGLDCDDTNPLINPGAVETCDNIDNNCNGILIETACGGSDAPVSPACASRSTVEVLNGQVFFNYGSLTDAINTSQSMSLTIGQPSIGFSVTSGLAVGLGFWTRFLLAPSAPVVMATEGDLPDRVQISWSADPLSPSANSYKIYRDGALLATVDDETFAFIDFNVIAGQFYTYEIAGVNQFGEGRRGSALGFLNPNGVVTGQVKTFSSNPVIGAVVKLTPTLGTAVEFDGISTMFSEYEPEFPREKFTLSCWAKIGDGNPTSENTGIFDFGSSIGKNWWLHAVTPADGSKGVKFGIGKNPTTKTEMTFTLPTATKDDWHHFAATYNGSALLFYVDGELVSTAVGEIEADSTVLFVGKRSDEGGYFKGKVDELRFYARQLAQTEIQMTMNQTVSATSEGLAAYWKLDEGTGSKGFDLTKNKTKIHLCGARWTTDKPEVVNAGISDATGFYKIEGVNYAAGQTFTATPYKNFYFNQSLEFNAANESFATLTNFDLPDSSTIEITVKNFDFSANQVILSKDGHFNLSTNAGNLILQMGSTTKNWGALDMGFKRLTFVLKQTGSTTECTFYKNGALVGNHSFSGVATSFAGGTAWTLGKNAAGNYFTGLIDEVVFFSTLLPLSDIQTFANIGTNVTHPSLHVYFNLNEGEGTVLSDMGTALTGKGSIPAVGGATWSTVAAISDILPHEFTPVSRLVTLNPSNTSADQIDFTDQSTIPVSGYVRFENTNCFQKGVEILVNGKSFVPQIFTDASGKFIIDLEPGKTVRLTPKLGEHTYYPAFWDLQNVASPVSGILFRNQTKRKVVGQVAGGLCRKSVIPDQAIVKVKVATLNGCYEQVKQLSGAGKFTFDGVPPDSVTVALVEHSNPIIYTFFQNKGGAVLDLKMQNDTTDFIYFAPPNVELTPLDTNLCGDAMLNMAAVGQTTVKVYEEYDGGRCYLDSAKLTINNGIADLSQFDTVMTEGQFKYKFKTGLPNIAAPHLKFLQVTAEAHDEQATESLSAVVLGRRARQTTFASTAPELPTLILRDPPGDGSFSFVEKGQTTCQSWSYSAASTENTDNSFKLSLGADLTTSVGLGAEVELEIEATADIGIETSSKFTNLTTNESETCLTTTERISTSGNDQIVGSAGGADVYMGGAVNYIFGITDELKFDTMSCSFKLDKGLYVFPNGFATTFVYSEYQIQTVVIPNLYAIGDSASARRWQGIIDLNTRLKNEAVFSRNLSFDAGVVYEQSETTETTKTITHEWEVEFDQQFVNEFGLEINGIGLSAGITMGLTTTKSGSSGTSTTESRTVGFSLADDDLRDNFTLNVKRDKAYGTPVFETLSGQSACPWEPNTQPREEVQLTIDRNVAVNIPENDVAIFNINLGNTSPSGENGFYFLELVPESNPNGATLSANGVDLTGPVLYQINPNSSLPLTVTIGRGPVEYDYTQLRIAARSGCEFDGAIEIGIPREGIDPKFYKEVKVDVHFLEPCSPVDVSFPLEGWVHTVGSGPNVVVTLGGYDTSDPDLDLIRVQFRRTQGDGAWINIVEIPKADLGDVFEIVEWNTSTLKDGLYEIRAVTQCFSGAQNPGISKVVKGKIERSPPEVVGTPEPADGVLSRGDEISIQFNEPIRCDQIIAADFFQNNNVGLYNTRTGDLVDAVVTCSGDKITIVPNVPNRFLENEILRVQVNNIKDLANNNFVEKKWEFFVDRNSLAWEGGAVKVVKKRPQFVSVTRRLLNNGGQAMAFDLQDIPTWARVYPGSGVIQPGAAEEITIEVDSTLAFGEYVDTLYANGAEGREPLIVNARVMCESPDWAFNPGLYAQTMNFTLQLDIEGSLSTDEEDIVAAFIDGQVRGTAKIQYLAALDKYIAFLTVFGHDTDDGKPINMEIWDASACLRYGKVVESFQFQTDNVIGTLGTPTVLHTNNLVRRDIPLATGWNWFSFNLALPDFNVNPALASLKDPYSDIVKSKTAFALRGSIWYGSLTGFNNREMYQYRADKPDTIIALGAVIDPASIQIPVVAGWNWIGYVPNYALTVNQALVGLTPLNGDVLKGQTSFAQYLAGFGWFGSIQYMEAPNGYQLKISNPGTLVYPPEPQGKAPKAERPQRPRFWQAEATRFEHSMTLVGMIAAGGQNTTQETQEIGAFVNGELRGSAQAIYIEPLDAYCFFLTCFSNAPGELVQFKLFDAATGKVEELTEKMSFAANDHHGAIDAPVPFSLRSTGVGDLAQTISLSVNPNPFRETTTVWFEVEKAQTVRVTVTDAAGRMVLSQETAAVPGLNAHRWDARDADAGVYFVRLETAEGTAVRRVVRE